jgi:integrase
LAAWLNARDGLVPIIPKGLLPARTTRRDPFIYSQADVDHLLVACPLFFANVRVATMMSTLIGLLAATGLRIGEAVGLRITDLDVTDNVLTVHGRKTPLDRIVPLDPSTTTAVIDYLNLPERLSTNPSAGGPIFVNYRGRGITIDSIEHYFRLLVDALELTPPGQRHPTPHGLRHTFATRHMITAYSREGGDPARTLTLLSTWLGHTAPEHTYWYLSAVPELLAAAAGRLEPAAALEQEGGSQ